MHEDKPKTTEDLKREAAIVIELSKVLGRIERRWGTAAEYDIAYRAVMDAIARCAAKIGHDLKQVP